ncbi:3-keto-5-aminohexanoate cleavage protein [Mesorhizobium sp. M0088]|uniref:3-keto-5-aminohexanoate cleavage protein n=1 Tax=Mesorhizobium sp. M0088 TaxID=2956873 RepID=UPI00333B7FFF
MPESCIIAVAITGSLPRKEDNPALPISASEQVESTHQAFEAGASLVHIHVRNDDQSSSSDPKRFAAVQEGLRRHCPGMIVQFSTGGRGRDPSARGSSLHLKPDMASLSTGSVNFPLIVYENHPALVDELASKMKANGILPEIEIFDLSHLHAARRLADLDLIGERPHIQFVLGVQNAMPAEERLLDIMLSEAKTLFPRCTWTAAGIGRNQSLVMRWALARSADGVRTGMEDNIRITKERLASSNAELVECAVAAIFEQGRRVASTTEARTRLGLAPS